MRKSLVILHLRNNCVLNNRSSVSTLTPWIRVCCLDGVVSCIMLKLIIAAATGKECFIKQMLSGTWKLFGELDWVKSSLTAIAMTNRLCKVSLLGKSWCSTQAAATARRKSGNGRLKLVEWEYIHRRRRREGKRFNPPPVAGCTSKVREHVHGNNWLVMLFR